MQVGTRGMALPPPPHPPPPHPPPLPPPPPPPPAPLPPHPLPVTRLMLLHALPLLHVQPTHPERWLSLAGWFDAHGLDATTMRRLGEAIGELLAR